MFHDRSLLGRCFRGFVLPVLEYCSAVRCSAADTHLKLLDRVVSGDRSLIPANGGLLPRSVSTIDFINTSEMHHTPAAVTIDLFELKLDQLNVVGLPTFRSSCGVGIVFHVQCTGRHLQAHFYFRKYIAFKYVHVGNHCD